jgi:hypothetical protein
MTDKTMVPATSPCRPAYPKKIKNFSVLLPILYLIRVESWDEQIFKVASMTADYCWSCGGQDDDFS